MDFEQSAPLIGPELDSINLFRNVCLGISIMIHVTIGVSNQVFVQVRVRSNLKSKDRCIANFLLRFSRILHHKKCGVRFPLKEVDDGIQNNDVKVKKEPLAFHLWKLFCPQSNFAPAEVFFFGDQRVAQGRAGIRLLL